MYEELKDRGFVVITVALDRSPEDARPYIEAAAPAHPSLIDTEHVVADLYRMVNVPTILWIDEHGRIVRPNDVAFGTDTYKDLTGLSAQPHIDALRRWVMEDRLPFHEAQARALTKVPTDTEQLARAEFTLAWYLHRRGRRAAAEVHFVRAGELAPHDFTIRRGSMPIRGKDPMGPEFMEMFAQWSAGGHRYYEPLPEA